MRIMMLLASAIALADTGTTGDTGAPMEPEVGFVEEEQVSSFPADESSCLTEFVSQATNPDLRCREVPVYDADLGWCDFTCYLQVRITPDS